MAITTAAALIGSAIVGAGSAMADRNANKKALSSAEKQKAASQAYIEKQVAQARSDIFKLFPAAQESRQKGLQAGLDLYKQAYPAMMNTFQQGNVGAQQMLAQGLPQIQNAILGNPVNMQGIQPVQLQQPQGLTLPNYQPTSINELGLGSAQ